MAAQSAAVPSEHRLTESGRGQAVPRVIAVVPHDLETSRAPTPIGRVADVAVRGR